MVCSFATFSLKTRVFAPTVQLFDLLGRTGATEYLWRVTGQAAPQR